jgi:small multidrug resistance pump
MSWIYLIGAILLEVAGTVSMKLSNGMTKTLPTILMFVFYAACFGIFSLALKKIEVGTAYAVWSGIGISLITVIGIIFFEDHLSLLKVVSIILIMLGIIGLNLNGAVH